MSAAFYREAVGVPRSKLSRCACPSSPQAWGVRGRRSTTGLPCPAVPYPALPNSASPHSRSARVGVPTSSGVAGIDGDGNSCGTWRAANGLGARQWAGHGSASTATAVPRLFTQPAARGDEVGRVRRARAVACITWWRAAIARCCGVPASRCSPCCMPSSDSSPSSSPPKKVGKKDLTYPKMDGDAALLERRYPEHRGRMEET